MPDTNLLCVGIDPAKEKHCIVALTYPENILLKGEYGDTLQDHKKLREDIYRIADHHHIIFGLEDTSNYGRNLCRYLLCKGEQVKEVNTMLTSRQRDSYGEDKDDYRDALSAAAVLLRRHEDLPDMVIPDEAAEAIRGLTRYREQLVKEKTQLTNQFHSYLTQEYPGYKKFFPDLNRATALAFFENYPTVASLQGVSLRKLETFLKKHAHNSYTDKEIASLVSRIISSVNGREDYTTTLGEEAKGFVISSLAESITRIIKLLKEIEKKLAELIPLTGYQLETFCGIKTVNAAKIISETISPERFGNDRNRYAKYNGTAPVLVGSGNRYYHKRNNRCNRLLKKTYYLISLTAYRRDPLSKEYVNRQIAEGCSKKQALVHLSRRISDIIFAMMRKKKAYNPVFKEQVSLAA